MNDPRKLEEPLTPDTSLRTPIWGTHMNVFTKYWKCTFSVSLFALYVSTSHPTVQTSCIVTLLWLFTLKTEELRSFAKKKLSSSRSRYVARTATKLTMRLPSLKKPNPFVVVKSAWNVPSQTRMGSMGLHPCNSRRRWQRVETPAAYTAGLTWLLLGPTNLQLSPCSTAQCNAP
jgi:hypothetical protein